MVVEAFLRGRARTSSTAARWGGTAVLLVATAFLVLGTYFFTAEIWLPAVVGRFG